MTSQPWENWTDAWESWEESRLAKLKAANASRPESNPLVGDAYCSTLSIRLCLSLTAPERADPWGQKRCQ